LLLLDRTQRDAPPQEVFAGRTRDLDWSEDSTHVAVLYDTGNKTERTIVDILMTPAPHIVHRMRVGSNEFAAFTDGRSFVLGPLGVGVSARSEIATTARKQVPGEAIGVHESEGGVIVAGGTGGFALLTETGDLSLVVPTGHLETFAASARSPYVVGMIEDRLVVWNLADVVPRRLAAVQPVIERFVGSDRVLVAYSDHAEIVELATRKVTPLTAWSSGMLDISASADGRAICLVDAAHHAMLVTLGQPQAQDVGAADFALFAGGKLVLATPTGEIALVDRETRERSVAVVRTTKIAQLAASHATATWIVAAFADRTLWRMNVATSAQATIQIGSIPGQLAVQDDGSVLFPDGRMLRVWRGGGAVEPIVELPKPVTGVGILRDAARTGKPELAIAIADDGLGFVVPLDAPRLSPPFDLYAAQMASASIDAGLLAIASRGSIEVVDPLLEVAHRWTLAGAPGVTYTQPQISGDGQHVIARAYVTDREKREIESRAINSLLVWRIAVPATPEETTHWLDQLTNAAVDPATNHLGWR
jgi:hypothetical protein